MPVEAVRDLRRNEVELEPAELLEVGELRDLHPVAPDLPAEPPRADGRLLPVVLDEADVVLLGVEPDRAQRLEVELEHVGGLRLQDHLVLEVVLEAHRVLAVAAVERPDHRLEVRGLPRLRPEAAQERRRVHRPGGDLGVVRRQQHAAVGGPVLLERQDDLLVRSLRHGRSSYGPLAHGVIRVRGASRQPARRSARAPAARLGARGHVAALPVRLRDPGHGGHGRRLVQRRAVDAVVPRPDRRARARGGRRARRRVHRGRRLAVPRLAGDRQLPHVPLRRDRPVRRRALPDARRRASTAASRASRPAATASMITPLLRPDLFGGLATHAGDALFEVCYARDFAPAARALRDHYDGSFDAFWADFRSGRPVLASPYDELLVNTYAMCAAYSAHERRLGRAAVRPRDRRARPGGVGALAALRSGRCSRARSRTGDAPQPPRGLDRLRDATTSTTSTSARRRSTARCSRRASTPERVHFELFAGTHRGLTWRYPLSLAFLVARPLQHLVVRLRRSRTCGRGRACSSCAAATAARRTGRARSSRARAPRRARDRDTPPGRRRPRDRRTSCRR